MRLRWVVVISSALLLCVSSRSGAYIFQLSRWAPGPIPMHLQLGPSPALIDGAPDWNSIAASALTDWNNILNAVVFQAVPDPSTDAAYQDGVSNVIWGDDYYGTPFGDALAITLTSAFSYDGVNWTSSESDVVFNRPAGFNSYRGALRPGGRNGTALPDFRRVALHEFGHVLGLNHPDTNGGQTVSAVMNARISNTETLQPDDIAGVTALYKGPPDTLLTGARLLPTQALTSASKQFRLVYQADGNLVIFDDAAHAAVWTSGTGGIAPQQALMQTDGNFVVYDAAGGIDWQTNTGGNAGARLVLGNDGNLIVFGGDTPLWDRLSAGQ